MKFERNGHLPPWLGDDISSCILGNIIRRLMAENVNINVKGNPLIPRRIMIYCDYLYRCTVVVTNKEVSIKPPLRHAIIFNIDENFDVEFVVNNILDMSKTPYDVLS